MEKVDQIISVKPSNVPLIYARLLRFTISLMLSVLMLVGFVYDSEAQSRSATIQAASKGDVRAMDKLGIMYASGKGVEKNIPLAKEWFEKAANLGFAPSQYNLGIILVDEEQYSEAALWLKKASGANHSRAFHKLGELHYDGLGVPKSLDEAYSSFLKAARSGIPKSMKRVAVMWQNAEVVEPDPEGALIVIRYLASLNDPEGQLMLGNTYDAAVGVEKNDKEAIRWCLLAAEQGHPYAKNNLGVLYSPRLLNDNPNADVVKSFLWFNLAAADGIEYAGRQREKLRRHMTPDQIKKAEKLSLDYFPRPSGFDTWRKLSLPPDVLKVFHKKRKKLKRQS